MFHALIGLVDGLADEVNLVVDDLFVDYRFGEKMENVGKQESIVWVEELAASW